MLIPFCVDPARPQQSLQYVLLVEDEVPTLPSRMKVFVLLHIIIQG